MNKDFLRTDDGKRLLHSAGLAAVLYLLLFLSFSLYFYGSRKDAEPFGASAVYLELMQVSQAPVRSPASNPGGSLPERRQKQQTASSAAAAPKAGSRPQTEPKTPAAAETAQQTAEEWTDDFFSDVEFADTAQVGYGGTQTAAAAASVSDNNTDGSDYSRLDSALNRNAAAGNAAGGETVSEKTTSASGLGAADSVSAIDLEGLTASRKLLTMVDPDFSGVDTAGRTLFSFVISFELNSDGTVSRVFVTDSSGSALADRRMEQALRQWRFASAPGSRPVNVRLKYYVRVR